jgi:hypothetical protein
MNTCPHHADISCRPHALIKWCNSSMLGAFSDVFAIWQLFEDFFFMCPRGLTDLPRTGQ